MRKIVIGLFVVGLAVCTASAQLVVNPVGKTDAGKFEAGAALLMSTIEYDGGGDINRTMMGGYGAFGINDMFDAYGSAAYSFKSDIDDVDGIDGSGFVLSGGVRAKIFVQNQLSVFAYGMLQYWSETYDGKAYGGKFSIDISAIELGAGALVAYQVMPELSVYGGLELMPFSSGESETTYNGHHTGDMDDDDGDVDRDTIFTIRGGATYNMGSYWLRGELAVGGETAFLAGAGVSF